MQFHRNCQVWSSHWLINYENQISVADSHHNPRLIRLQSHKDKNQSKEHVKQKVRIMVMWCHQLLESKKLMSVSHKMVNFMWDRQTETDRDRMMWLAEKKHVQLCGLTLFYIQMAGGGGQVYKSGQHELINWYKTNIFAPAPVCYGEGQLWPPIKTSIISTARAAHS